MSSFEKGDYNGQVNQNESWGSKVKLSLPRDKNPFTFAMKIAHKLN